MEAELGPLEISELFNKDLIITNLDAKCQEGVFQTLYDRLYQYGFVKESYLEAIKSREKNFPTGLKLKTYNVAIPHTDTEYVNKSGIAMATLKEPIVFRNMANPLENIKVNIVFMIALSKDHSQVELLQQLIQLIQNDFLLEEIMSLEDNDKVEKVIKDYFRNLNNNKGDQNDSVNI